MSIELNEIIEHIPAWNGWIALLVYWMPLALCVYGYSVEFVQLYRKELKDRAEAESENKGYYLPRLTVGWIVGHVLMAIMPIANMFAAIFNIGPKVFGDLFDWFGRVLDIPLVPKRKKGGTP